MTIMTAPTDSARTKNTKKLVFVCDPPVPKPGERHQATGGTHQVAANLIREMPAYGYEVDVYDRPMFADFPKGKPVSRCVEDLLENGGAFDADYIHVATEGHLGFWASHHFRRRGLRFTTAYHTQYPEFVKDRFGWPEWPIYSYLRWFHNRASQVIVPTPSMAERLAAKGFKNTVGCLHGVDTDLFKPGDKTSEYDHLPRPFWLNVGRAVPEKNLDEGFLALGLPGTKFMVGDGPLIKEFSAKYPDVIFAGLQRGEDLARFYRLADVFVFPSFRDTFGLVNFEALASGLPVAAMPETGPKDFINSSIGCLHPDMLQACLGAWELAQQGCADACRAYAEQHSWYEAAGQFLSYQTPARGTAGNGWNSSVEAPFASLQMSGGLKPLVGGLMMKALEKAVWKVEYELFGREER